MVNNSSSTFSSWDSTFSGPLLIAGPCSAESENQILSTGRKLHSIGVNIFRAGIWKPRTRPNSFEGVGDIGLPWLKSLQDELGIKVAIEVANAKHVQKALNAGIDVLWIGARSSVNPFSIQEIADSLKGVDVPILVKNPINPDVDLWQGAIERILSSGIKKIAAVHRGFSSYNTTKYRNLPMWEISIEMRRRMPDLPMICDPSHIGGRRALIHEISQKAMDLNYDGLMVESHTNPDYAWTDSSQQITPDMLQDILKKLVHKVVEVDNPEIQNELTLLRNQIDHFDNELIGILKERMNIASLIGEYKSENNVTILQPKRWQEILTKSLKEGSDANLSQEFMRKVFSAIHQESINKQTNVNKKQEEIKKGSLIK